MSFWSLFILLKWTISVTSYFDLLHKCLAPSTQLHFLNYVYCNRFHPLTLIKKCYVHVTYHCGTFALTIVEAETQQCIFCSFHILPKMAQFPKKKKLMQIKWEFQFSLQLLSKNISHSKKNSETSWKKVCLHVEYLLVLPDLNQTWTLTYFQKIPKY